MSTSNILLDRNFNGIDVDIMVFEPSVLYPPPQLGGGKMTWSENFVFQLRVFYQKFLKAFFHANFNSFALVVVNESVNW